MVSLQIVYIATNRGELWLLDIENCKIVEPVQLTHQDLKKPVLNVEYDYELFRGLAQIASATRQLGRPDRAKSAI